MAEAERLHVADLVRGILTEARKGHVSLLEEKLGHVAFLLEHPGWQVNRPTNLEAA